MAPRDEHESTPSAQRALVPRVGGTSSPPPEESQGAPDSPTPARRRRALWSSRNRGPPAGRFRTSDRRRDRASMPSRSDAGQPGFVPGEKERRR